MKKVDRDIRNGLWGLLISSIFTIICGIVYFYKGMDLFDSRNWIITIFPWSLTFFCFIGYIFNNFFNKVHVGDFIGMIIFLGMLSSSTAIPFFVINQIENFATVIICEGDYHYHYPDCIEINYYELSESINKREAIELGYIECSCIRDAYEE